jgi:hypothetical protein
MPVGEELRGYLLKGPVTLEEGRILLAAERAHDCLSTARELANLLAQCEDPDRLASLARLCGIDLEAIEHVHPTRLLEVCSELCVEFSEHDVIDFIDEFVEWWESQDDTLDPTVHSRLDPDDAQQQILFVGATSDSPYVVSYGCRLLQTIQYLGVLQILGIK